MKFIETKGARVPALGFGTWDLRGVACERAVATALGVGYRHIDTAQMYENEEAVGRAIAASGVDRGAIFLTTKIWHDRLAPGMLERAADDCLRRLGVEYVDLLLIHWPSDAIPLAASLAALATVKAAGKARHIGVSNFPAALLARACNEHGADLLCDQVEYHPFLAQNAVLAETRPRGMMLTAYCPLAQGRVAETPELIAIGRRHGKTPAQIALRWLVQQDLVAAIPKAASEAHCLANLEIFDVALDAAEMAAIAALARGQRLVDPAFAPRWDPA